MFSLLCCLRSFEGLSHDADDDDEDDDDDDDDDDDGDDDDDDDDGDDDDAFRWKVVFHGVNMAFDYWIIMV